MCTHAHAKRLYKPRKQNTLAELKNANKTQQHTMHINHKPAHIYIYKSHTLIHTQDHKDALRTNIFQWSAIG